MCSCPHTEAKHVQGGAGQSMCKVSHSPTHRSKACARLCSHPHTEAKHVQGFSLAHTQKQSMCKDVQSLTH
eukprot:80685-Alexandrium_andersonii.AAC.1